MISSTISLPLILLLVVLLQKSTIYSANNGISIQKSTRLDVEENVTANTDQFIYKPTNYRVLHNYYDYQRQRQPTYYGSQNGYYGYQQPTYYYSQQATYYYPSYNYYPSYGGGFGGGGGGIFGFCLVCFGIG